MYKGLSFYSFKKFNCKGIESLHLTDLITYHDITVFPFSIKRKVNGGNAKDSIEMTGDMIISNADTVIIKDNPNLKIRRLKTIVDQNEAILEIVAEQSGNNADEIGKLIVSTDEISTEVKKKVGEDEIISKINQTAEAIKILAKYIQLEGIITANGNIIIHEDGSIEVNNGKFKGKVEGSSFITKKTIERVYTENDIYEMRNIIENEFENDLTPTKDQLAKYDLDNNGIIDTKDVSVVSDNVHSSYQRGIGKAVIEDIIEINMEDSGKIISYRKINGEMKFSVAINSGSIKSYGGSFTVNGEEVITRISGTLARFG